MSKIFKVEMYIDNVCNTNYSTIEDILEILDRHDLTTSLIKCEERDTTEYLDEVEDNYGWNTTNECIRVGELNKYFDKNKE